MGSDAGAIEAHLKQNVRGEPVEFTDERLATMRDAGRIRKVYRVNLEIRKSDTEKEAEAFVLGSIALKGS